MRMSSAVRALGLGAVLALCTIAGTFSARARPNHATSVVCEFIEPAPAQSPHRKSGPLAAPLRQLDARQWSAASKALQKLEEALRLDVARLFHGAQPKTTNTDPAASKGGKRHSGPAWIASEPKAAESEATQKFLDTYVFGSHAVLYVDSHSFDFVPVFRLSQARAACELSQLSEARRALASVRRDQSTKAKLGAAALACAQGDSTAALEALGPVAESEGAEWAALRGWARLLNGEVDAAAAEQARARAQCVGPAQCGRVERLWIRAQASGNTESSP